jgi:dsRNA-specific ribonuclease
LYLYGKYPTASEGEMSMCRSQVKCSFVKLTLEIVNNDTLAACIQYLGFDKFLRHASPYFTFEGPRFQVLI